jgi:hypothetical protein
MVPKHKLIVMTFFLLIFVLNLTGPFPAQEPLKVVEVLEDNSNIQLKLRITTFC